MIQISEHDPVVAFTLVKYPRHERFNGLARLGLDRVPLRNTAGLSFWRLLGVGRGQVFDPHADLQRYAIFSVWESLEALRHFEVHSSVMQRIYQRSEELWTVHMLPVRWHGAWGGSDPLQRFTPLRVSDAGPWVILTRATVRPTKWRTFLRAVPPVASELLQRKELIRSVGVGEAPLFYQATVSLWRSLPAATSFAYGPAVHANVIRRTRNENWYREELFARFRPIAAYGTWDGTNPLPAAGEIESVFTARNNNSLSRITIDR